MERQLQPEDYLVIPDEAIKHLPDEWHKHISALKGQAQSALQTADPILKNLNRLVHAFPAMASLRYIQHRLASTAFEATIEWVLETDMLTLAFVMTYARLIDGGIGSGVSRDTLPPELRPVHDKIIDLRNKRYAHNTGHETVVGSLDIGFQNEVFDISVRFHTGLHVAGAPEWKPLVEFLDNLMHDRLQKVLKKLKQKTGHEWTFSSGPPPLWASSDLQDDS